MACANVKLDENNLSDRRLSVACAFGTHRAEGMSPDAETIAAFGDYTSGSIDLDEVYARVKARFASKDTSCSFEP